MKSDSELSRPFRDNMVIVSLDFFTKVLLDHLGIAEILTDFFLKNEFVFVGFYMYIEIPFDSKKKKTDWILYILKDSYRLLIHQKIIVW